MGIMNFVKKQKELRRETKRARTRVRTLELQEKNKLGKAMMTEQKELRNAKQQARQIKKESYQNSTLGQISNKASGLGKKIIKKLGEKNKANQKNISKNIFTDNATIKNPYFANSSTNNNPYFANSSTNNNPYFANSSTNNNLYSFTKAKPKTKKTRR